MGMYLTKDRQNVAKNQKAFTNFVFQQATDEEIKKALGDGVEVPEGYVAGWASTSDIDSYNHVVVAGAFSEAIQKRGLTGPKGIKLLLGHNWNQLAGVIKVLEYRGSKLWIEAQLALDIGYVSDAYKVAKMAGGLSFSVGFMLQDYEWKETPSKKEFLQINRGDLFEVSVVPFPGNEEATMTFIKDAGDPLANDETSEYTDDESDETMSSMSEFEKTLVLNGMVKNRKDAHAFVKLVKANLHLFQPKVEDKPDTKQAKNSGPVLDMKQLTALQAKLAEMKAILKPPVAE